MRTKTDSLIWKARPRDRVKPRRLALAMLILVTAVGLTGCIYLGSVAKEAGVENTDRSLQRRVVFASAPLGVLDSITLVPAGGGKRIVVGGTDGAAFLTPRYLPEAFVQFKDIKLGSPAPIDVDGDGRYEFMARGGGWSPVKLVSAEGRLEWQFPPERGEGQAPNQMAAGDLNGDGFMEFVVGMNGGGGVIALDRNGKMLWRQDASNAFCIDVVDVNADGKPEIVHIDGRDIVIRNGAGDLLTRFRRETRSLRYLLWPTDSGLPLFAGTMDGTLALMNANGDLIRTVKLPRMKASIEQVQPVRFGGSTFYAASWKVLYNYRIGYLTISDEKGTILHKEMYPTRVDALAALPDLDQANDQVLLAGVATQVIEYRYRRWTGPTGGPNLPLPEKR